ncbi:NAD(+) diphosphatase [Streptomyces sp. NPDC006314]|uniref:NAD(+) diphosphatase n=1 Tax=Streptomyces sp. NPDC006314 TaxID=3154475 RepID=UPI0033BA1693
MNHRPGTPDTADPPPGDGAAEPLDRSADRREDGAWLRRAWRCDGTRVLPLSGGRTYVTRETGGSRLALVRPRDCPAGGERYLLGTDRTGTVYFAYAADRLPDAPPGAPRVACLDTVAHPLSARDHGMLAHATALENWHRSHGRCCRCGGRTAPELGGHLRRCTACGAEHHPRTDPAVLVLVTDGRDRCLLGSRTRWPPHQYSVFAGYVEPGETAEAAVRREAAEEAAVAVGEVRCVETESHPFPGSLMLGYRARADSAAARADGREIAAVRWFTRDALAEAVRTGRVALPDRRYLARRLLEEWYGGRLAPRPEVAGLRWID